MVVSISNDVQHALEEYRASLSGYPISKERAHEKYDDMVNALIGLGTSISTPPVCTHKNLGQIFDSEGNPMIKGLRRFNYKDKSGFQWAFACHYNFDSDTIRITKMMPAIQVKESIERFRNRISRIVNEEINKAIAECERLV